MIATADFGTLIPFWIASYGTAVLAAAGLWHWWARRQVARWTKTHGIVEDYEEVQLEGGPGYNPHVVFLDVAGEKHRFKAETQWSARRYAIGQPIPIIHHPRRSERAYLDDGSAAYQLPIALYVIGGFLLVSAFGLFCFLHAP